MKPQIFTNEIILSWLQYFAKNTPIDLERVKMLDITRKNKNLIPTVESHKAVLVFTEAGYPDIFYKMWNAGLGDCEVWYNEGSDPEGDIKHDKLSDMINRGINASAGMLIVNENARNTYKIGMNNQSFKKGSIRYVGSEIRSVILNKMHVGRQDDICVISGESIAIESAIIATEGTVIAVEYNKDDRATMEDNIDHFGLNNIMVVDHVDEESMKECPVPSLVFMVASASMEQELEYFTSVNPQINVVVYTLDFGVAASMGKVFEKFGFNNLEELYIGISNKNPMPTAIIDFLNLRKNDDSLRLGKVREKDNDKCPVYVSNAANIAITLGNCCTPIPGDEIVGYITKGKGVTVHRKDCPNVINEKSRLIEVFWKENLATSTYPVDLKIECYERSNLVVDIMSVLSQKKITITSLNAVLHQQTMTSTISITIYVPNGIILRDIINNLLNIKSVYEIKRATH